MRRENRCAHHHFGARVQAEFDAGFVAIRACDFAWTYRQLLPWLLGGDAAGWRESGSTHPFFLFVFVGFALWFPRYDISNDINNATAEF
jgi:hypothetical protein